MSWTTCSCLAAAYCSDPPIHVGHPEVLKRGPSAGKPWLAGHDLLIHLGGKPLGRPAGLVTDVVPVAFHQLLEGFTPRQLVWRVDEHTVNVEDCTLIWHEPSPVPKRGLWVEAVLPRGPVYGVNRRQSQRRHGRHFQSNAGPLGRQIPASLGICNILTSRQYG